MIPRALQAAAYAAAAGLLAGLLLGWRLWAARPADPALLASIDTVLVAGPAFHDTLRIIERTGTAQGARAARAEARADSLAAAAARLGAQADSALALARDSGAALAYRTGERDRLREEIAEVRAANRAIADARTTFYQGMVRAEARVTALEAALAEARGGLVRARPAPRWAAGAMWEPGRAVPVGGFVAREVGPLRLQLEATDGPTERPTARLAAGLRF